MKKSEQQSTKGVSVRVSRNLWREMRIDAARRDLKLGEVIRERLEAAGALVKGGKLKSGEPTLSR